MGGGVSRLHAGQPWAKPCSVDGCAEAVLARGWCNRHYLRWRGTGDPLGSLSKPRQATCSVAGCDEPFLARGMCRLHYGRWRGNGTTERISPAGENRYDALDLLTGRLTVVRGEGSEHSFTYDLADHQLVSQHTWHVNAGGYATTAVGGRKARRGVFLHRLLLGLAPGDGRVGDHINGDRTDNRRANLRIADHRLNAANQAIINQRGSSEYRGVCWDKSKGKWKAYTRVDGLMHNLGHFDSEREAADVVIAYRARHHVDGGYLRRHDHTPVKGRDTHH